MFNGFPKECTKFFADLKLNNNKSWFDSNKDNYKKYVLAPFQEFVIAISGKMLEIDPLFELEPKIGKTISRIYKDMRFSKDKTPYRTNSWIAVKRKTQEWKASPSYYFDLSESEITYGIGYYLATKDTMDKLRVVIEDAPEKILAIITKINNETQFKVEGENYKKILNKKIEPPLLDWYQKKNIYLMYNAPLSEIIYTPQIADKIINDFTAAGDFYNFLLELM